MNREQRRRAEKEAKRKVSTRPPKEYKYGGSPLVILNLVSKYSAEERAKLSNEARLAWYKMTMGEATETHYDVLCYVINIAGVLTEHLPEVQELVTEAGQALGHIRLRYIERKVFGVDSRSLKVMPDMLDFHDELLEVCTPKQFIDAVREVNRRIQEQ